MKLHTEEERFLLDVQQSDAIDYFRILDIMD